VKAAVQRNGEALYYASGELKGNKEVVQMAVQQNGTALQYAVRRVRGNAEVVLAAMRQDPDARFHVKDAAWERLKKNKEISKILDVCVAPTNLN
jgi:hypothetical protein